MDRAKHSSRSGKRFGRRSLLRGGIGIAVAAVAPGILGAAERIRLGFVGVGNRGDQLLEDFVKEPDQEIVAFCDVYRPYLEAAAKRVSKPPFLTADHRAILDRKDIDAVVIATPDHWHAIQTIDACRAGKDVYVEKPLSLTVREGRAMVKVARETSRVVQVGLQRRSNEPCRQTAEIVRGGGIGKVSVAKCYHIVNESPIGIGKAPRESVPEGLDWDRWLGPAPFAPYDASRSHYRFRWFWDYSGGQLTNFGTHYLDVIQWALGRSAPKTVTAVGGKFALDDDREIPDTLEVIWTYEGGTLVSFSQVNASGAPANPKGADMEFRGTWGTLYLDYGGLEIVPEKVRTTPLPARGPLNRSPREPAEAKIEARTFAGAFSNSPHIRNFLDCVKNRAAPNCDIETGHRSTTATLLGNIALKMGRTLAWDAVAEEFTNCPEANVLLSRAYRAPWKLEG